jgi:hypothetical protein
VALRCVILLLLLPLATTSTVSAQDGRDGDLRSALKPGRTVWVTDRTGREEQIRVVGISGDVLTTTTGEQVRRIRTADVMRVRAREADPVLNGALIGAGAAVASGLLLCSMTEPWANCRDDVGPMLRIGGIGAAAGIGLDALIRGRKTVFEASPGSLQVRVTPTVAVRAGALQLTVIF